VKLSINEKSEYKQKMIKYCYVEKPLEV